MSACYKAYPTVPGWGQYSSFRVQMCMLRVVFSVKPLLGNISGCIGLP